MKAILIDPETKTVQQIEYDGDYNSIYKLIGCDTFTVVQLDDGNALFLDDEGLLNDTEFFFRWDGANNPDCQPFAGKGLILGTDEEGDSIATTMDVDDVRRRVTFARYRVIGWKEWEGKINRAGEWMPAFGCEPVLEKVEDSP